MKNQESTFAFDRERASSYDESSKRRIMSECLISEQINPELVHSIFVTDHSAKKRVEAIIGSVNVPVVPEPHMFFQPRFATRMGFSL